MCGIFGVANGSKVTSLLLSGLRNLEYRGYDSAGVAVIDQGRIERRRAPGKLANLQTLLESSPVDGRVGIAHTRWATHGVPDERNAHPHATGRVAVAHNGIVENYADLRSELAELGYELQSDTDSEVIPHLITHYLAQGLSPFAAVQATTQRLVGTFALGVVFAGREDFLIGARRGSPLAVGVGEHAGFLASDGLALAPMTSEFTCLEEGDHAIITQEGISVFDQDGSRVNRRRQASARTTVAVSKGTHRHYMHKEIYEQPAVLLETLRHYTDPASHEVELPQLGQDLASTPRVQIVACGTSYYAGMVAKYWFENIAKLPVDVDIASEFRYRNPVLSKQGVTIYISQSGETADTLAALRYTRSLGQKNIAIVNAGQSSIAREADAVLQTYAGPEVGVASTKAFTTQLAVLALLAICAGRARGEVSAGQERHLVKSLLAVADNIARTLQSESQLAAMAEQIANAHDVLFLSRGCCFPVALEGALKLKEVSYIHAEGYAAGELKHGPIALVDDGIPVIILAPNDPLREKTVSNMREVMARRGKVFLFTGNDSDNEAAADATGHFTLTESEPVWAPFDYVVPLQLLAYHVALAKGTDVDQPRNLAKSVTVE